MAERPRYVVRPPLRCFFYVPNQATGVCGAPAAWTRVERDDPMQPFFCDAHKPVNAVPIGVDALFRRVGITADVLFTGTSFDRGMAHTEALQRLERAVEAAGGVLNLHACRSEIGRLALPAAARGLFLVRGDL